jgi:hypothetical protein
MCFCAIKSLAACLLGAAVIAGCASPHPSQTAIIQNGKVVAIQPPEVAGYPGMEGSSGEGASGTSAGSEPILITVLFADGTQGSYAIDQQPVEAFAVGDLVQIVTDSKGITTIVSP